jgi:DNA excision repair protein ERCC-2
VAGGVLVDEAHNLVERARTMYSASLSQASLRAVRTLAPAAIKSALDKVNRGWNALRKAKEDGTLDSLPSAFMTALKQAGAAMETHLAEAAPGAADGPLQQAYFDILGFQRLAESFGTHSVLELTDEAVGAGKPAAAIRIQNQIPAPFLKPRFAAARTVTLFSATLSPPRYYLDMLGLPDDTAWIDVESPFSPDQLEVHIVSRISTRYTHRQRSAAPIARLIGDQFAGAGRQLPGVLQQLRLPRTGGELNSSAATPMSRRGRRHAAWTRSQRQAFLDRFAPEGRASALRCWAAASAKASTCGATVWSAPSSRPWALPQVNARNEQLKACLEGVFGAGYDYTYLSLASRKWCRRRAA